MLLLFPKVRLIICAAECFQRDSKGTRERGETILDKYTAVNLLVEKKELNSAGGKTGEGLEDQK